MESPLIRLVVAAAALLVVATPSPAGAATPLGVIDPVRPSTTQGPGFEPLSDAGAAARVRRSPFEPRAENARANRRVPRAAELARFYAARSRDRLCRRRLELRVTGRFRGTTDEILQWGAYKWGVDADVLRAMATVESWWRQSAGDDDGGGLLSVRWRVHRGTYPLGRVSTAFNVDFVGAVLRHYLEGCARWLNHEARGRRYVAGDLWGSVGAWYAGRWHTRQAGWYVRLVRLTLAERRWAATGF